MASLSQTTLPYVLGLTSARQVWESLSNRYNSLSRNHVQELKHRLYSHTKLTTMEAYIDTLKDYAQKLAAVGSPIDEEDLIFHTLRGLPKVFNGFKTTIRTRGSTITFDELVTMLNGEDLQLLQETDSESTTVLVANHSPQVQVQASNPKVNMPQPQPVLPSGFMTSTSGVGQSQSVSQNMSQPSQFGNAFVPQGQFLPQQYFPPPYRSFPRGRGRGFRHPCAICGRNNHTTNFCHYKSPQSFDYSSLQWRTPNSPYQWPPNPWMSNSSGSYTGVPMSQSGVPMFQPGTSTSPHHFSGSTMVQPSQFRTSGSSTPPLGGFNGSIGSSNFGGRSVWPPQAHLAGFSGNVAMTATSSGYNSKDSITLPFGFSGTHQYSTTFSGSHPWYFDSGATNHITNNLQNIDQPHSVLNSPGVMVGNGTNLQVSHAGKGILPTPVTTFQLSHILHTPHITHNLISVHHFAKDNNCLLIFDSSGLVIQDKTTLRILYQGPCHQGLYPLLNSSDLVFPSSSSAPCSGLVHTSSPAMQWHQKLGHPSLPLMHALIKQQHLHVSLPSDLQCSCCNQAKSHKLVFPLSETHSTAPFDLVHMDVWGPAPIPSNKGFRYYLLIVDDFSRYTWLFPLHYKFEVKFVIANFKAFVVTQFQTTIKTVRSDNGGEFVNHFLLHLFLSTGILHQTTCPHTPEQNGIAERKHRHLIETTITLLLQASLPTKFWFEALTTAVYLVNRLPHSSLQFQVPFTLLFQTTPSYHLLKPFGCLCFPWLKPYTSHKLQPKSSPCIFLGYYDNTKGYKCYDPSTTKVYISRHVRFVDTEFPFSVLSRSPSTSFSSSESLYFSIPLTSFDDIIIPVTTFDSLLPPSSVPLYHNAINAPSFSSVSDVPSAPVLLESQHMTTPSHCSPHSVSSPHSFGSLESSPNTVSSPV